MMRWTYKFPLRLRSLFRKGRVEQELADELRFHLEELTHENAKRGMKPEEARYAAMRELGGAAQIKEECRDLRRVNYIENLLQDVRYGLRMLVKNPGFTVVAVLTLALGIGANTAIFSVVYAVLLKPLPFRSPGQLVRVFEANDRAGIPAEGCSYAEFREWQRQNHVFSGMAGVTAHELTLTGRDEPTVVGVGDVTATPDIRTAPSQNLRRERAWVMVSSLPGRRKWYLSTSLCRRLLSHAKSASRH